MSEPLYTPENCRPAYQLRWSLALFCKAELPPPERWLEQLKMDCEQDLVRILEFNFRPPNVCLFLLSTQPSVVPPQMVKTVKGRLQSMIREEAPRAFRRNFSLTSVGNVSREVVENYVANQLDHHQMVDETLQQRLREFQISFPDVDLSSSQFSSHGCYLFNLHLVLAHQQRWHSIELEHLERTRDMVLRVAKHKAHRLSEFSLFADHLHLALGCHYNQAPEDVALGYLNNLAYAHGMQELYCHSYYVGTFGEYDMGVVWQS